MERGRTFWDFASEHPIALVFIVIFALGGIAQIVGAARGDGGDFVKITTRSATP